MQSFEYVLSPSGECCLKLKNGAFYFFPKERLAHLRQGGKLLLWRQEF